MVTGWKEMACLILALGLLAAGKSRRAGPVVPLGRRRSTPGVKIQDPQNRIPMPGPDPRMDKPELRVFLPPASGLRYAVVICPGGGYGLLDYKAHVAES